MPLRLTSEHDLVWDEADIEDIGEFNLESKAHRRNERIISTLLAKRGVDVSSTDVKTALNVLVKQYSIKSSVIVQWIVNSCIKVRKSLCPKYINTRCKEVLAKGIVTYEQTFNPLSCLSPARIL